MREGVGDMGRFAMMFCYCFFLLNIQSFWERVLSFQLRPNHWKEFLSALEREHETPPYNMCPYFLFLTWEQYHMFIKSLLGQPYDFTLKELDFSTEDQQQLEVFRELMIRRMEDER